MKLLFWYKFLEHLTNYIRPRDVVAYFPVIWVQLQQYKEKYSCYLPQSEFLLGHIHWQKEH